MSCKKMFTLIVILIVMLTPFLAIAEISNHEYNIFSCLYLASKANTTMTLGDVAEIANQEAINYVDYSTSATGDLEPMLNIYFTPHILLSFICEADNNYEPPHFWEKNIHSVQLSFLGINWDTIPIVALCLNSKPSKSNISVSELCTSDEQNDNLSIHGKDLGKGLSDAEYSFFAWFLAAAH